MKTSLPYKLHSFLRRYGVPTDASQNEAVIAFQREMENLGGDINIRISLHEDGSWSAKSTNVEGIITGGRNQSDINAIIKDAIFTYYGIPPSCVDSIHIRNSQEPVTVERNVRVTA